MSPLRFLHTADIHLGKPFGGYACADRLRVARQGVLARLIAVARAQDVRHILVAGDLFETPNPAAQTWRQAAAEMAEAADVTWWLLPGNHDNLRQGRATWEGIAGLGHANLRVLDVAEPVELQPGAIVLPAPLTSRRPTDDPTAWMDQAETDQDAIRIGLAHGPIRGFGEGDMPADIIAPDRALRARLDWLALGDWHGMLEVTAHTAYSGAPERTDFSHNGRGLCLLVDVAGPGQTPKVQQIEIGGLDWRTLTLDLVPGDDVEAMIDGALPETARRDILLKIKAQGRLGLREATALAALEERIGPDFCHFEIDMRALGTEIEAKDLDAISLGGALRRASDALAQEAVDDTLSEPDRKIAEAALRRLHALVAEDAG